MVDGEMDSLRDAVRRFFPERYRMSASFGSSGYSGSTFARVETPGGSWLVRCWPWGFEEERLRFIHRVLFESRSRGFSGVPDLATATSGETIVHIAGFLYDAQSWMLGEALSVHGPGDGPIPNVATRPSPERLTTLAEALARFHASTAHLSLERKHRILPLRERLRSLEAIDRGKSLLHTVRCCETSHSREVALRWLSLLPRAVVACESSKALSEVNDGPGVLCHGDLWPAHVRFDGDNFTGFTDFESLIFASPAFDLAQLVLHFGGWEARETIVCSYATLAPLDDTSSALLSAEAVLDLVGEGIWALESLYGEFSSRVDAAQRMAHELNLRRLLGSLERIVEEVEAH